MDDKVSGEQYFVMYTVWYDIGNDNGLRPAANTLYPYGERDEGGVLEQ